MNRAFAIVPVRVALVLFRSFFNGWCTARRFQVKHAPCLFGCTYGSTEGCHDSIEHYAHCQVVRDFAKSSLDLPDTTVGGLLNFLCLSSNVDDETRILQLLLLYAVYSATNCMRYTSPNVSPQSMHEFLLQFVHQGASQLHSVQVVVRERVTNRRSTRRRLN